MRLVSVWGVCTMYHDTLSACTDDNLMYQQPAGFDDLSEMINRTGGQSTWVPIISSYFLANVSNPPKDIVLPSLTTTPFGQYVVLVVLYCAVLTMCFDCRYWWYVSWLHLGGVYHCAQWIVPIPAPTRDHTLSFTGLQLPLVCMALHPGTTCMCM